MDAFLDNIGLYTDFYELTMAQGYFCAEKKDESAVFDYFFRSNPYDGGYLVFAGLQDLLHFLENFKYSDESINYLHSLGFKDDFLEYLKKFSFGGSIYSVCEGEIVFSNEPIIRIEGNIIETQLVETILLNFINFQSLIATKACRIRYAAGDKLFADFGLRRAHGLGGIHASRAAIIGGADSTSNVFSGFKYNVPVSGTQAHSWVQSFDDELTAFRKYAEINPNNTTLLVDTYNTLQSGVPNAIIVAKELEAKGYKMVGIRLDSGDLAFLSKKVRKMLNDAGLDYVKIIASNQLNEYVINSLNQQGASIDGYGVGTELVTGKNACALDGVYKLAECNKVPNLKISENIEKITLPGRKKTVRYFDDKNKFNCDGILLHDETLIKRIYHPLHPEKNKSVENLHPEILTKKVMENGKIVIDDKTPQQINRYVKNRFAQMPDEHKRFISPHIYKVGVSKKMLDLRSNMLEKIKDKIT